MKIEVFNFGGWYASRVAYENSKTYGEGISSIGLTIFELHPKTPNFSNFLEMANIDIFLALAQKRLA